MNYDNLLFVYYPGYAGGKFLINCLGLSNNAYLQDINLAVSQLNNKLTPTDKLNLLLYRLEICYETNHWNDLDLGLVQLFGDAFLDTTKWSKELLEISTSNKLFFMDYHGGPDKLSLLDNVPNKKIIKFINSDKFINWRNKDVLHKKDIDIHTPYVISTWDATWYLNQEVFLIELKKLYLKLHLPDFNEELILPYYTKYIKVLTKLR